MNLSSHPVLVVMAIAVVSSLLAEIRIGRLRVPVVVWEMLLGILVGPYVLALVHTGPLLDWFGGVVGLAALFFTAGMDLDLQKVKGRPLSLATHGWIVSLILGLSAAALLHFLPFTEVPIAVGLALTTTSMGTFMPILRDSGVLKTKFGSLAMAAGAVGEFGPVVAISLLLTHKFGAWQELALTMGFVALAFAAALIALGLRPPRILALLERSMNSSTQLPVCISLLLLACFDFLSESFGLEAVLGAFAAGMIVGLASRGDAGHVFRGKTEAICFGFFVPFFFVVSGINFDLGALLHNTKTMLLMPLFLVLFLLVRGAPVFLYKRDDLATSERWPFALYSATALPMVVAIVSIEVHLGRLTTDVAAALVGAGLLSVLLFPMLAGALLSTPKEGAAVPNPTVN
jgi:Kef-type K+ transport system membrane component KefB